MKKWIRAALMGALLLAPLAASAADVFVNGVAVRYVEPVTVNDCVVTFGPDGSVHIRMPENATMVDRKTGEPIAPAQAKPALFSDKRRSAP